MDKSRQVEKATDSRHRLVGWWPWRMRLSLCRPDGIGIGDDLHMSALTLQALGLHRNH